MSAAVEAAPAPPTSAVDEMPAGLEMHKVRRRLLALAALTAVGLALIMLVPGLAGVRQRLAHATPGWLARGAALEVLSCLAYVVAFRAAFCARMTWWTSYRIGMSSLGAAAFLPAGGIGGLALGAWALRRGGLPLDRVARRTVAFFVITSAINFAAVIVVGVALAVGIAPGTGRLLLSAGPVGLAVAAILLTLVVPHLAARLVPLWSGQDRSKLVKKAASVLDATGDGVGEAVALLRSGDPRLIGGAIGYLAFDIAVLWTCFRAFGTAPPLAALLLAYLLGQLGSLIPVPGRIGGVDAGLIGALVLYGTPVAAATVGVIVYRALLLLIPGTLGGLAFAALRRSQRNEAAARIPCADDIAPAAAT